jgi:hypothetical protein
MNVKDIYNELVKQGYTKKDAAKQAQARTGKSAVTGKTIDRQLKFKQTKNTAFGQYTEVKHGRT